MDGRELLYRGRQAMRSCCERAGIGLARSRPACGSAGKPWCADLPQRFSPVSYVDAAHRVMAGRFSVFALRDIQLGYPPQWNRDPKTGATAPLVFGKTLDYRDERAVGDIKYLWELNRHLELVTLAQAWHLTRDRRYAESFRTLLISWLDQCPYPAGAQWTSSLELAIRLVNWSFSWHLLGGETSPLFEGTHGRAFKIRWLHSVYQHCHFISRYLSLHSSANNHLLGELMGLFVGAVTWPLWEESPRWRRFSRARFQEEALRQNAPDGVNREQAAWYHHEVADMMLIAGLIARANGCDLDQEVWQRFEAMLEFIASIMDVNGNVPAIGDADDAVIVRFCPATDWCAFKSLLATGAVLFARADFKKKAGAFDDKSRWLLGDAAAGSFAALDDTAPVSLPKRAFPVGGYYVLGADFDSPEEVRIVADAGPLGYLALAAHGHADALAFTLSVAGQEMLVDAGTFAYHTNRLWREYFRGTSAHNTIRVDGLDQSVPGGNFLWLDHAAARCESFQATARRDELIAVHDGYRRLADSVIHRRQLVYLHESREIVVTDSLLCRGRHDVEMFWHCSSRCDVSCSAGRVTAKNGRVTMTLSPPKMLSTRLVRADSVLPLGWMSRRFDEKTPCTTIVSSGHIEGEWHGETRILIEIPPAAHG